MRMTMRAYQTVCKDFPSFRTVGFSIRSPGCGGQDTPSSSAQLSPESLGAGPETYE